MKWWDSQTGRNKETVGFTNKIEMKKKGGTEEGKVIVKVTDINSTCELLNANLKCIYLFLSQTQNNRLNINF